MPAEEKEAEWDIEEQDYASLAEEMTDPEVGKWVESDWDADAVKNGKAYAQKHDLPWPPGRNDFDRWYELKSNNELR